MQETRGEYWVTLDVRKTEAALLVRGATPVLIGLVEAAGQSAWSDGLRQEAGRALQTPIAS
jgi:hypothetical protein